jgi:hypothetical protein
LIEDLGVNNGDMLPTLNTMAPKSPPSNTRENRHSLEKVKGQKATMNDAVEVHCSKQTAKELPLKCSSSMRITIPFVWTS